MADTIDIVVNAVDNFSGVLGNFGNIMTGIKSTLDLVGQAFNTVYDFGSQFVQSAMDSQNVIADLNATLASTGNAVGLSSQQLQDMATQLQNVTKFSDETITSGEAMLLTFTNIGGDVFPQATEAMLNLAEKFGSVDSAAVQLGKALNDPISGITALQRVGVSFSDTQKQQIADFIAVNDIAGAQGVILAELNKEFGGLAEAAGQTFAGQLEIAKNQLDNIKETIGTALLPVLSNLLTMFQSAIPTLQVFAGAVAQAITTGNFTTLVTTFEDGSNYLGTFIELLGVGEEQAYAFGDAINKAITNPFGGGITNLVQTLSDAIKNVDWAQLSQDLADGMKSIDWAKVGQTLSSVTLIILDTLATVISHIDWGALLLAFTQAMGNFIAGIAGFSGWSDMVNEISTVLAYEFNRLKNIISNSINDAITNAVNSVKNTAYGIGQGLVDGIVNGWTTTWDNVKAFWTAPLYQTIDAVKQLFGISSPSSVFADIGKNIVLGLIQGWSDTFDLWVSSLKGDLNTLISLFPDWLKNALGLGGSSVSGLGASANSGTLGGSGTAGGGTGSGTNAGSGGNVVNNYYGPVYFQGGTEPGSYYDCPSPNPFTAAGSGTIPANAV